MLWGFRCVHVRMVCGSNCASTGLVRGEWLPQNEHHTTGSLLRNLLNALGSSANFSHSVIAEARGHSIYRSCEKQFSDAIACRSRPSCHRPQRLHTKPVSNLQHFHDLLPALGSAKGFIEMSVTRASCQATQKCGRRRSLCTENATSTHRSSGHPCLQESMHP